MNSGGLTRKGRGGKAMKQKTLMILVMVSSVTLTWVSGVSVAADYRPAMLANPCVVQVVMVQTEPVLAQYHQ